MSATTGRHRNEVTLVGEIAEPPAERELATGDQIVTFRLAVAPEGASPGSFDCSVSNPRSRRAALGWQRGDLVEVSGALRRRFYRSAGGTRPFPVVEAERVRRIGSGVKPRRQTRG